MVAWILLANYRGSLELRENLLARHAQRVAFDAVSVGHALEVARGEARGLAESREVAAFLESRDLGMSMQYGLALALVPIRERARALVDEAHAGGRPVFIRVALVDPSGATLADTGAGPLDVDFQAAGAGGLQLSADGHRLAVVHAHRFRGRLAAFVVGWINPARVLPPGHAIPEPGTVVRIVTPDGRVWMGEGSGNGHLPSLPLADLPADGHARELPGPRGVPAVVVRAAVPGQSMSLVHVHEADHLVGALSPVVAARNLALAAVVVLLAVVAAVVLNIKALLLQARLDESLRRGAEVAEKHRALMAEMAQRERLEERLRHVQRLEAIGTLAGGVAHDFNNLLSVIVGYTMSALERLQLGDPSREDLVEVRRASLRATDLTRQLLAFGRRQILQPRVLHIAPALAATEKMLLRLLGVDIELVTRAGPEVRPVRVDPGQLEQVVVNLLVNARDAMPAGGRVTVSAENAEVDAEEARLHAEAAPGSYVRLRVADTGTGMDAATLSHVFEPFFTTKPLGKGTGLGLSTVYGIVRQSRGFVAVSSAPGKGSTFDVYLPADPGEPEPVDRGGEAPRPRAVVARPGETVLVADDEPQLLRLMKIRLSAAGFDVLTAANGTEAIRVADQHEGLAALVTDVTMPGLSGAKVAEHFRARRPGAPLVFLSGYAENAVLRELPMDAPAAFLQKPQDFDQLVPTLRRLLDEADDAAPDAKVVRAHD
jgi:signal transduction histidine kinase/ActR/RegA family two-component response regulator